MDSARYLSSARVLSVAILAIAALSWIVAGALSRQMNLSLEGRRLALTRWAEIRIPEMTDFEIQADDVTEDGHFVFRPSDRGREGVLIDGDPASFWIAIEGDTTTPLWGDTRIKWHRPKPQRTETRLQEIADQLGVEYSENPLVMLERVSRGVSPIAPAIPGVRLHRTMEPGIKKVSWILGLLVLLLLVIVNNRVRYVELDPKHAIGEPWLITDAVGPGERFAAGGWLVSLLVAPWVSGGAILFSVAAQNRMQTVPVVPRVFWALLAIVVTLIGGVLALRLAWRLLSLREQREELVAEALEAS